MTREDFMKTTLRLQELYNKKLNETQLLFWFDELKDKEAVNYRRAVGEYTRKNKTMPSIADILSVMNNLKPLDNAPKEKPFEVVKCDTCRGSGLVKYWKDGYAYYCKCFCDNRKLRDGYPFLDYETIFYYRKPQKVNNVEPVEFDISQINF